MTPMQPRTTNKIKFKEFEAGVEFSKVATVAFVVVVTVVKSDTVDVEVVGIVLVVIILVVAVAVQEKRGMIENHRI